MSQITAIDHTTFIIPQDIITPYDLARLVREFEDVDNELTTLAARQQAGADGGSAAALSSQVAEFLSLNNLQYQSSSERTALIKQLRLLKVKAPVVHMTFATEADTATLQHLVGWLRQAVHPQAVLVAGLQPGLVAGVHMRTKNQVFDFSLRKQLRAQRDALIEGMESVRVRS